MIISTKGRYGLRAAVDVAIHGEKEAVSLAEVAKRQNISLSYLEQLIAKLRKADIVDSVRGAQGGYVLGRPAGEITVGEILRSLEGDLNPVECAAVAGEEGPPCEKEETCVTKYVWQRISDSINKTVDGIRLSELVEEARGKERKEKTWKN